MFRRFLPMTVLVAAALAGGVWLRVSEKALALGDPSFPPEEAMELRDAGFPFVREEVHSAQEEKERFALERRRMRMFFQAREADAATLLFAAEQRSPSYLSKLRERRDDPVAMTILADGYDIEAAQGLRQLAPDNAYADVQVACIRISRDAKDAEALALILQAAGKNRYESYKAELETELLDCRAAYYSDAKDAWLFASGRVFSRDRRPEGSTSLGAYLGDALHAEHDADRRMVLIRACVRLAELAEGEWMLWQAEEFASVLRDNVSAEEIERCTGMKEAEFQKWLNVRKARRNEYEVRPLAVLRDATPEEVRRMEQMRRFIGPNFARQDLLDRRDRGVALGK